MFKLCLGRIIHQIISFGFCMFRFHLFCCVILLKRLAWLWHFSFIQILFIYHKCNAIHPIVCQMNEFGSVGMKTQFEFEWPCEWSTLTSSTSLAGAAYDFLGTLGGDSGCKIFTKLVKSCCGDMLLHWFVKLS